MLAGMMQQDWTSVRRIVGVIISVTDGGLLQYCSHKLFPWSCL